MDTNFDSRRAGESCAKQHILPRPALLSLIPRFFTFEEPIYLSDQMDEEVARSNVPGLLPQHDNRRGHLAPSANYTQHDRPRFAVR